MLRISIITVSFNSANTIRETLNSLFSQDYDNVEFILVDGNSTDETMTIVKEYESKFNVIISENDSGMYDALNKGVRIANGDVIGILNTDDIFTNNNILSSIAKILNNNPDLDAIIGDIVFVNEKNKIIRNYSSKNWSNYKFKFGFMPPHPSFYCKKDCFNKFGYYNTDFKIAGDFELLLRFLYLNKINYKIIQLTMVNMKLGGLSTGGFKSLIKINNEIIKAYKINNLYTNYFLLYSRYFFKIFDFLPNILPR